MLLALLLGSCAKQPDLHERLLTLPLAMGYCASTSVAWPVGVPAGPSEAEAMIGSLGPSRHAYLAIRARVTHVDASWIGVRGNPAWDSGGCRSSA